MTQNNKQKLIIATLVPAFAFAALGASTVLAHDDSSDHSRKRMWHHKHNVEKMVEAHAEILGLTTEELQALHDEGKTFEEILEMQGLTKEEFKESAKAYHQAKIKAYLDQLVADGELTQEEADAKYAAMLEKMENHEGKHHWKKHRKKRLKRDHTRERINGDSERQRPQRPFRTPEVEPSI